MTIGFAGVSSSFPGVILRPILPPVIIDTGSSPSPESSIPEDVTLSVTKFRKSY
ncbi:Peptide transporter PTR1 [Corchorus capsularis]|uniref:Peptide transporter PTR1 n=1 Tax=Corchorus capsularis TaxID=210143 RepID=A0A1R3JHH6_COCAP|nr:Peptide transporter PTR1 [Corchorus capsularis]